MYATLNISDTSIKLLSIKGRQIRNWASVLLAPGMVRDGLILQPEAVGEAIDDLFKSTKIAKDQVIVTLTGLSFTDRIVSLPKMKSSFVEEAILRGAREEIPLPLEELYLSWQAINSHDDEIDFFILYIINPVTEYYNIYFGVISSFLLIYIIVVFYFYQLVQSLRYKSHTR